MLAHLNLSAALPMAPLMLPPILSFISLTTPPYFDVMPPTTLPTTLPTAFLAAPAMLLVMPSMLSMFFRSPMSPRPTMASTPSSSRLSAIENSTRRAPPLPSRMLRPSVMLVMRYDPRMRPVPWIKIHDLPVSAIMRSASSEYKEPVSSGATQPDRVMVSSPGPTY